MFTGDEFIFCSQKIIQRLGGCLGYIEEVAKERYGLAWTGPTLESFLKTDGCVVPIPAQGEHSLSRLLHKYLCVFFSRHSNWVNRLSRVPES